MSREFYNSESAKLADAAFIIGRIIRAGLIGRGFDDTQLEAVYDAMRTAEYVASRRPEDFPPEQAYLSRVAPFSELGDCLSTGFSQKMEIPGTRIEDGRTIYAPIPVIE